MIFKTYEYLTDADFLKQVDLLLLKEQYAKITILDWYEDPIRDITGIVTGGNLNIDGSSAVRRTCNLNVYIHDTELNVEKAENLFSLNKKVAIEIGFKNTTDKYTDYDIIWYPIGIFVIINPSISHSTGGTNVSLQLKDKMCLLNGEVGGTLPASVTFNEIETYDEEGNTIITTPTMYQIIQEAVNHWGGEQLGKIIIDLDTRVKKVMKWMGTTPVYLYWTSDEEMPDGYWSFTTNAQVAQGVDAREFKTGEDVGYIYTDFIYPGEDLIGDAGTSVVDVLETLKNTLGNYEYFYDINGNFHFQEIKNFLNTTQATIDLEKMNSSNYIVDMDKGKSEYQFNDGTLISSYSNSPQYNMIKNDFVVWGQRTLPTGQQIPIRYHLAIDKKPEIGREHQVFAYQDPDDGLVKAKRPLIFPTRNDFPEEGTVGVYYLAENMGMIYKWSGKTKGYEPVASGGLRTVISDDWRTELYLQGVDHEPFGTDSNYYYTELITEWPKLYDIWGDQDKSNEDGKPGFYEEVKATPSNIDFFLDFIDSTANIGEFSVQNIGRRSKVVVDDSVNCIFEPDIPDFIIIEKGQDDTKELREESIAKGQRYTQVESTIYKMLTGGGSANSAYEYVKDLLYQYTSYNESISISCVPIFHLEVNTRITVKDIESNISGDYVINNMSIPFDINSTMTISASRALERDF